MANNMIWITGADGHVGSALRNLLPGNGYHLLCTNRKDVDVTDAEAVRLYAEINRPNVIINCAGLSSVEACAENPEEAYKINAIGARNLAIAADRIGAKMIQMSTDDVFSGDVEHAYNEFDPPAPRSIYGKSKLAGEQMVSSLCSRHIIIRSSWVYGTGLDFVDTFLNAGATLEVATNESAVPTSAKELAKTILKLIDGTNYGIFHIVCTGGPVSRYDYALKLKELTGKEIELIPITVTEHVRPIFSLLDNMMLRISNIPEPANWEACLSEYLKETT